MFKKKEITFYKNLGDSNAAISDYLKALELKPKFKIATNNLEIVKNAIGLSSLSKDGYAKTVVGNSNLGENNHPKDKTYYLK